MILKCTMNARAPGDEMRTRLWPWKKYKVSRYINGAKNVDYKSHMN